MRDGSCPFKQDEMDPENVPVFFEDTRSSTSWRRRMWYAGSWWSSIWTWIELPCAYRRHYPRSSCC
jgi:hypothetical protein